MRLAQGFTFSDRGRCLRCGVHIRNLKENERRSRVDKLSGVHVNPNNLCPRAVAVNIRPLGIDAEIGSSLYVRTSVAHFKIEVRDQDIVQRSRMILE